MSNTSGCACNAAPKLVFACSGAADVGELSGLAARKMTRDGTGKMYCLTGIGGHVSGIMETTQAAKAILVIDGCQQCCGQKTLQLAGFTGFMHLQLTNMGFVKGETVISEENIEKVSGKGAELLRTV